MDKKFCKNQISTKDNPNGYDCTAHMHEARCFACPYSLKDIKYNGEQGFFISHTQNNTQGACIDFDFLERVEIGLVKKVMLKKQFN